MDPLRFGWFRMSAIIGADLQETGPVVNLGNGTIRELHEFDAADFFWRYRLDGRDWRAGDFEWLLASGIPFTFVAFYRWNDRQGLNGEYYESMTGYHLRLQREED